MSLAVVDFDIRKEQDTITARQVAQQVAQLAGMSAQDRTRLATAVSEVARNALQYAGGGHLGCSVVQDGRRQLVQFVITDAGPGIPNLEEILSGRYRSRTGMGVGLAGSKKLMDGFCVKSSAEEGTVVSLGKEIPPDAPRVTPERVAEWAGALNVGSSAGAVEEMRRQEGDVLRALEVLKLKEQELAKQLGEAERLNLELRAAKQSLHEQAMFDALTELPNRRSVMEKLEQELARARRTQKSVAVALGDIDFFKKLNDTYGHLAGDSALKETARRMEGAVRPYDCVGRYGGEEFLLLMPGCELASAAEVCERVRTAVGGSTMVVDEGSFDVTISMGVAATGETTDAAVLIDVADAALYRAKENGRDRVELATTDDLDRVLENRPTRDGGSPVKLG